MNENKVTENKVTEIKYWNDMWELVAVAFPKWVIRRMTERSEGKGLAIKAIPFVIMFLSVASIANLSSRAWEHHANFSSYMTGAGIAVLVPIAVIAAMIVEGRWSWGFWAMAVVFALVSGTIQYNIYLMPGGGFMGVAEAVAFGYGVPLSEVMLAIMEARLVIQFEQKKTAELKAKEEDAKAAQLAEIAKAEAERQRIIAEQRAEDDRQRQAAIDAENREFERQKRQADLEAYRIELQQKAELERERALADLRIKEQKAAVKNSVKSTVDPAPATTGKSVKFDSAKSENFTPNKTESRRQTLLKLLKEIDGQSIDALNKSALAKRLDVSRPTLNTDLAALESVGKIALNGHVAVL